MGDRTDNTWDRAKFVASEASKEMHDFLKSLEARGPASTREQLDRDKVVFLEIQARCQKRALEIFERASSGNSASHLSVVKRD